MKASHLNIQKYICYENGINSSNFSIQGRTKDYEYIMCILEMAGKVYSFELWGVFSLIVLRLVNFVMLIEVIDNIQGYQNISINLFVLHVITEGTFYNYVTLRRQRLDVSSEHGV